MFWTRKKSNILCFCTLGILVLQLAVTYEVDTQQTSLLKRGDFASFYSAAMIVRQGLAQKLNDTRLLSYVENLYWPSLKGNYVSFPYPPFVSLMLVPLAFFPPQSAKLLFTVLMMLLAVLAVKKTETVCPVFKQNRLAVGTFLFAFFPISFGILGGQFTGLNLFLYAGILSAYHKGTQQGDVWAGIFTGIWCFKPQYAAVLICFFLAARAWRPAMFAMIVALIYYLVGAGMQGVYWPYDWALAAGKAAAIDFPHNDFNMVSLSGFSHAAGRLLNLNGGPAYGLQIFSWILSACLAAWMGFLFWKAGGIKREEEKRKRIQLLLELSAPVLLLTSPHALFYDIGICAVACARHLKLSTDFSVSVFIFLTGLALCLTSLKAYIPFQPMIFYVVIAFFIIVKQANISCERF